MAKISVNLTDEELERVPCENMGLSKLAQINCRCPEFTRQDGAKRSRLDKYLSRKRKALNEAREARYEEAIVEAVEAE